MFEKIQKGSFFTPAAGSDLIWVVIVLDCRQSIGATLSLSKWASLWCSPASSRNFSGVSIIFRESLSCWASLMLSSPAACVYFKWVFSILFSSFSFTTSHILDLGKCVRSTPASSGNFSGVCSIFRAIRSSWACLSILNTPAAWFDFKWMRNILFSLFKTTARFITLRESLSWWISWFWWTTPAFNTFKFN